MSAAITLAHHEWLRVGQAEIRPATCEVLGPGGREETEPRVMQVLVALAEAMGETVTRGELIQGCWGRDSAGEEAALDQVIGKIRRLARGVGGGSFAIKTIHKAGYRLVEGAEAAHATARAAALPQAPPATLGALERARSSRDRKRVLWGGIVALALLVATATWSSFTDRIVGPTLEPGRGDGRAVVGPDPAAADWATSGRSAVFEQTPVKVQQAIGYFRQALALTPENPTLWGWLAMSHHLDVARLPPRRQAGPQRRSRQAALRALGIDPREGLALAALVAARPNFGNWPAKEAGFRNALARYDPESPAPIFHHGRFLASVGRTGEALLSVERAARTDPDAPWIATARINLLAASGRIEEAERLAAAAGRLWPRNYDLWLARFFLHAFNDNPAAALALADAKDQWPEAARPADMALLRRTALAIASRADAEINAVLDDYAQLAGDGQSYAEQGMRVAAFFGRAEAAIDFAERLYAAGPAPAANRRLETRVEYALAGERPTEALFIAPADRLWTHPRFLPLMERIGLIAYWRRSAAPDLCGDPALAPQCRRYGLDGKPD